MKGPPHNSKIELEFVKLKNSTESKQTFFSFWVIFNGTLSPMTKASIENLFQWRSTIMEKT